MELIQRFLTKNPCYKENVQRADERYRVFQDSGSKDLMLHSSGCAQPSAEVFYGLWNREDCNEVCVHAAIDANTGNCLQFLPWNYRGWHCGTPGNNTHIGVEMCESKYIRYLTPGESGYAPGKFVVLDRLKARSDCERTYNAAVELFAMLSKMFGLNPDKSIISHSEGYRKGIATNHGDPEHYWIGLGMGYTMDGFRKAVKQKMQEEVMNEDKIKALIAEAVKPLQQKLQECVTQKSFASMWEQRYTVTMKALSDNDAGRWSAEAREWAIETGLLQGVGKLPDGTTNYAWGSPLTREMYAQTEYRQAMNGVCKF